MGKFHNQFQALYGANAFNGILLMRSKNPFDHQGVSGQVYMIVFFSKVGVEILRIDAKLYFPLSS